MLYSHAKEDKMKQELLAPAGDIEAGYAALYYGADALYLGLRQFSARATASNFSEEELCQITGYAHSLGRKIYVTINTLVQNDQIRELKNNLDICAKASIDGLIVQDLGVAYIVKNAYPELELHASTQMAVHNKEGALYLKELGFKRVVLARELSLQEIKEITSIPDLETECFIHGALCYAYSGLCQFSSFETGMSANRGKCLYPCRACFNGDLGEKHLFSMKDMALEDDVLKLPANSLKIEGRKKSALYVAAVVNYYRKLLDKKSTDTLAEDIKQIFARPWTKFHFNGKNKSVIDTDFVGHRGLLIGKVESVFKGTLKFKTLRPIARYDGIQIDVKGQEKPFGFSIEKMRVNGKNAFEATAGSIVELTLPPQSPFTPKGSDVYLASSSRVKGAYHYEKPKPDEFKYRMPVDVDVSITSSQIKAAIDKYESHIDGSFEVAKDKTKVAAAVQNCFEKTGNTNLKLNHLTLHNEQHLFVPASVLNELRRMLYEKVEINFKEHTLPQIQTRKTSAKNGWIIKTDNPECIKLLDFSRFEEFIIVLNTKTELSNFSYLPKNKVRLSLPAIERQPARFKAIIEKALNTGYKKWEIGNYWALEMLPKNGIDLTFDNTLYMMNGYASQMAQEMNASRITLAVEDTKDNLILQAQNSVLPTVLVVYQDTPLFISANCIRPHSCKECKGGAEWFSLTKGKDKYEALSVPCQTTVFSEHALCLSGVYYSVPADFYRIDFCGKEYTPEQVKQITSLILENKPVSNTTQANWQRRI